MNNWNTLLVLLDKTLGFPNKIRSTVKRRKKGQGFDQRTGDHVFVLEYRIKVRPGIQPKEKRPATPNLPPKPDGSMGMIRHLIAAANSWLADCEAEWPSFATWTPPVAHW